MKNENQIVTGLVVKFKEVLDAGDEKAIMLVLDDYGEDSDRCLVRSLCSSLTLKPTNVHLKSDLIAADLTTSERENILHEVMVDVNMSGKNQSHAKEMKRSNKHS